MTATPVVERWVSRVSRVAWAIVAMLVLGVVAVVTVVLVSGATDARIQRTEDHLATFGKGNRQVFCNTERLLLIRAAQNGYRIPAHVPVDVCGLPIIGNPPLPPESTPLPVTATVPPAPRASTSSNARSQGGATSPPAPRPSATPAPTSTPTPIICIAGICP